MRVCFPDQMVLGYSNPDHISLFSLSLLGSKWEEFGRPASSGGGMSKCYLTFDAEFKWTTGK